jgi:hypothetical protein
MRYKRPLAGLAGVWDEEQCMAGIYFALCMIGVVLVIRWYIANDGLKDGEPTKGFLAMRKPTEKEKKKAESRRKAREPEKWSPPGWKE